MVFLSNYLVFKIVLAALGRVDYPVAGDLELKYDTANKIYLSGGSLDYVDDYTLHTTIGGETTTHVIPQSPRIDFNNETRQAAISIYDGKEINKYANDTPCTYAVQFTIVHNRLDMCVTMRSNDLWYGFCNDQYQFSKLQEMVSKRLNIETGVYYHFAHNMHLYNDKI
mgnify:CR=1 FL=1